jgi:ferrous iron transport protein A
MQLIQAKKGAVVRVVGFTGAAELEHKLRQLGLIPGDLGKVMRLAPMGGPLMIEINGRAIALGRRVAASIIDEETPCVSPS